MIAYIDGFNLYNGLKDKHGRRFHWLNLEEMCQSVLREDQRLVEVKYFTAPVRGDAAALQRQQAYWNALRAHCRKTDIHLGRFQKKTIKCRRCDKWFKTYEEKETDVSIAVALVEDAVRRRYDTALIVSADSDLCPGIRAAKRVHRGSPTYVAAFPPDRTSGELAKAVDASFTLGVGVLKASQLPPYVTTHNGTVVRRPPKWQR